jgi:hypothetical protein
MPCACSYGHLDAIQVPLSVFVDTKITDDDGVTSEVRTGVPIFDVVFAPIDMECALFEQVFKAFNIFASK